MAAPIERAEPGTRGAEPEPVTPGRAKPVTRRDRAGHAGGSNQRSAVRWTRGPPARLVMTSTTDAQTGQRATSPGPPLKTTSVAMALTAPQAAQQPRAAVISRTRINLHRKMVKHAAHTGQYPVAVLSDCVVYASPGPSPLDFLPYRDGRPLPGGFKLGVNPGLVKHEGTQTVLWGEEIRERFDAPDLNLARYIKDGTVTEADSGE